MFVRSKAVTNIDEDDLNLEEMTPLISNVTTKEQFELDCSYEYQRKRSFKEILESFFKFTICKETNIVGEIKCWIVFLFLLVITVVISVNKEAEEHYKQFSVFQDYSPSSNFSVDSALTVIRVRLRGPFGLESRQGKDTNLTVIIKDMRCYDTCNQSFVESKCECRQIWLVPVLYSEVLHGQDIIITKDIAISRQHLNGKVNIELQTSSKFPLSIGLSYSLLSHSEEYQVIYAATILLAVYILIIFDIVHRSLAAILGSLAALATLSAINLKPSLSTVISWLDFDTLCLLFGMMIIVGVFSETGFFDWIAFMAFKMANGKPWPLLIILCSVAAFVSAFLDNVTTVLLLTPVSIRLSEALKMDPKKVLIAEVLFSNIGGTATAIGDPPNVILVSSDALKLLGINFTNFTLHLSIGTVFITLLCLLFLRFLYRDLSSSVGDEDTYRIVELKREIEVWRRSAYSITIASQEEATVRALLLSKVVNLEHELGKEKPQRRASSFFQETLNNMRETYVIKDRLLLLKCSMVLGLVILSFFLSSIITGFYLDLGWIAFLGAIWILVLSNFANLESLLDKVEWTTLIFFAALFALMKGLEELKLISFIGGQVSNWMLMVPTDYRLLVTLVVIVWLSAIVSSFIDNIPYTTAMIPVVIELGTHMEPMPLVWALAFGACLGGNGTLIGASANVVVAGIAQQHGYSFTFMDFFKVGFPMMLFSTFLAMIYIIICHVAIGWNQS